MNESFGEKGQPNLELVKKKKLWRNLFFSESMRFIAFS